jgi:catechol 2,3-dioxygenase-like lactoylglutathione lyase family enzyme
MPATAMNHFTILTDDVPMTVAFYRELLGLTEGPRPPFDFPGAWLYAEGVPILHVIGGRPADELRAGVIDHMAFTASDVKTVKARFDAAGVKYDLRRQTGSGIWQLFSYDPNGAKVELDFDPTESL